ITSLILFSPLLFSIIYWKKFLKEKTFQLIMLFLVTSLITVYPRFSFFHLQPAIAFLIIIFVRIFVLIPQKVKYINLLFLILTTFLVIFFTYKSVVGDQIRFYGDADKKIAQEIIINTRSNEDVFLLGINSSQYVFIGKNPPKHWSDNFGWYLEIPDVQNWVIEGLKSEPPKTIFWRVPSKGNWYDLGVYQPKEIVKYIMRNYHKTGNIEKDIEIWERN
ncbi:MAG: hypothetical protein Q7R43_05095, partial [Candidatus Daviesbacteria bacterium]|nr:hypothetical protein [Candidatus Daviesbacteria bacterium]